MINTTDRPRITELLFCCCRSRFNLTWFLWIWIWILYRNCLFCCCCCYLDAWLDGFFLFFFGCPFLFLIRIISSPFLMLFLLLEFLKKKIIIKLTIQIRIYCIKFNDNDDYYFDDHYHYHSVFFDQRGVIKSCIHGQCWLVFWFGVITNHS